jgi:hypothetical protein
MRCTFIVRRSEADPDRAASVGTMTGRPLGRLGATPPAVQSSIELAQKDEKPDDDRGREGD